MGRYLMDQIYGPGVVALFQKRGMAASDEGVMGGGAIVPRFRNIRDKER